ncbi:Yip1 family protein [Wenjunlia vitaminophila]
MGRGGDPRPGHPHPAQGQPGGPPAPPPYQGGAPYYPPQGPHPPQGYPPQGGAGPWSPQPPPHTGEPQYLGQPGGPDPYGDPRHFGPGPTNDDPGHTRAFVLGEDPYGGGQPDPYQGGQGDDDSIATYRAGQSTAPPAGPRLHWKDLLRGLVLHPQRTFWQMRDYQVWGPALIVTFLYGILAVFGFEEARDELLDSSMSTSFPWVLMSAIAVTVSALVLGAVTHSLARQLGGDGIWAPTIGLSMLVMSLTDSPRLLFAVFLPADNGLVQILGWATWLLAGAMLTTMVQKSHDLPWPRALGACSIQLVALLLLLKLPTIG